MSCYNVRVSRGCRAINALAALASTPLDTRIDIGEHIRAHVHSDRKKVLCSVGAAYTPMTTRVSRVCSLGVVDDGYELFYLADGNRYLLYDGKTFRVVKNHDERI